MDELILDFLIGSIHPIKVVDSDLQGSDALEDRFLKSASDGHGLSGGLHLCTKMPVDGTELIERPSGDLHDHIIDSGFECRGGGSGDLVGDLVEVVSDCNLRGDTRNRVSGGLGCQCGRSGDTGVDLDEPVVTVLRVEGELYVASSFDFEGTDDLQ